MVVTILSIYPCIMTPPMTTPMYLNMSLYDGLADESGSKEGPERNQKVPTSYPSQVKERIGNLT
jgi:hypothetical protein